MRVRLLHNACYYWLPWFYWYGKEKALPVFWLSRNATLEFKSR